MQKNIPINDNRRTLGLIFAIFLFYNHNMKRQSGNALFLILIAVALFAALSQAITNSSRGGGSVDREQAEIDASLIVQQGALVKNAVMRTRILDGNARISHNTTNGLVCSSNVIPTCVFFDQNPIHVEPEFSVNGRDYTWIPFEVSQNRSIRNLGDNTIGDQIVIIEDLPEAVCAAINKGLGLDTIPVALNPWPTNPLDITPIVIDEGCVENTDGVDKYFVVTEIF